MFIDLRPCHGEDAKGIATWARRNLTDAHGSRRTDTIIASVHGGRRGHMPAGRERLTTGEIRTLALYVHDLGTQQP